MRHLHTVIRLQVVLLLLAGCQSSPQSRDNDRLSAMQTLKRLAIGCYMYSEDNDGMLPKAMTDLQPYVDDSYDPKAYVLVASGKLTEIENPERAVLIRQIEPLPDGAQVVAFADGHVEVVSMK